MEDPLRVTWIVALEAWDFESPLKTFESFTFLVYQGGRQMP